MIKFIKFKFIDNIFSKFLYALDNIYTFFILRVSGYLILSIFINIYILMPLYNIYRSIFVLYFDIYILIFFLLNTILLSSIFQKYNSFYTYTIKMVFSDITVGCRDIISLGALFLKKYPFQFALYIFISISSIFLIRMNPNNTYIHTIHCICVIFRNIFIIPALGYSLLINTNKKQCERLGQSEFLLYIFRDFPSRFDPHFFENFLNWMFWCYDLKPSFKIVKRMSYVSLSTTWLWYSSFLFQYLINLEIEMTTSHIGTTKKIIDNYTFLVINKTSTAPEVINIATNIKKQMNFLYIEYTIYNDDKPQNLRDYILYLLKRKKIKELNLTCIKIYEDYRRLNFCEGLKSNDSQCKELLNYLTRKYRA